MFSSYLRLFKGISSYRTPSWRLYHNTQVLSGKPTKQLIFNMGPPGPRKKNLVKTGTEKQLSDELQPVIDFYKLQMRRDLEALNSVEPKLIKPKNKQVSVDETILNTYTQLPEDSQYIEHHYKHLIHFRNYLSKTQSTKKTNLTYVVQSHSPSDGSEWPVDKKTVNFADFDSVKLLKYLHDFILSRLLSENIQKNGSDEYVIKLEDGDKVNLSEFVKLLVDVKITLNLNCNHTFILDTLLYNKETFDVIDKKIQQRKLQQMQKPQKK